MRPVFDWNIGSQVIPLGKRTLLVGILNVTPDSFSDGGLYLDCGKAVAHGLRMLDEGANIIDVGGESTRPGVHPPLTESQELDRVIPVVESLKRKRPASVISIDTYRHTTARAAFEAGAEIVNDVSGLSWDPKMAKTIAALGCGIVLMHTRGRPEQWRSLPPEPDILMLVKRDLRERSEAALMAGIKRDHIILDPGFGFGKSFEENYPLLKHFDELHSLRYPLMAGVSRKSFIGRALARTGNDRSLTDRLYGTLAAETAAILKGTHIVRTHDVSATADAAKIADIVVL